MNATIQTPAVCRDRFNNTLTLISIYRVTIELTAEAGQANNHKR